LRAWRLKSLVANGADVGAPNAAIVVATVTAGCAAPAIGPAPQPPDGGVTAAAVEADAPPVTEVDIAEINRMRCEPVMRTGTRIVIGERCYPAGPRTVDEEALAEQLEQVRRDQEELDRRRSEAEARRGPGL
jgi:hypothetical protein